MKHTLMKFKEAFAMPLRNGLTKPSKVRGSGIPMVNMKEIFAYNKIYDDTPMELVPVTEKELENTSLEFGDLLFARQSLTEEGAGKVCIYNGHQTKVFESHLIRCRLDQSRFNSDYFYYFFSSSTGKALVSTIVQQTAAAGIRGSDLQELEIPVPPLPEQKAIASVLSSLDDKIDLLHRQNKTLEAMAETLFRQWFIEEAKEDWEEVPLSDYFKVKHGYAFKGEFITPEPTKYRLVTPGNFEIGGGFKSAKFKYYSSDVIPEEYVFNELDFVVTMTDLSKEGDTLGYPAFIPLHHKADVLYLHNQRVGKVQFYDEKECKFFFYMLMKQDVYQQFIVGSCTGTSVKHTSPTTIGSFTFAKPPQEKIHDFDRIVGQKFAKIFVNQKQIQTLENLRNTLLPKLMSGEVRVQYQTEEVA